MGVEPALFLGRGYTGQVFGLINMNVRLYDPALGRFLSPDPYVQAPDFNQNFNRYSYCLNNPLRFTDESGKWIHILIGAVVGGTFNLVYKAATGQIHSFKGGLVAFAIGTVGSAVSMPIQNLGNHLYFGDPLMSVGDYAKCVAFGAITGGVVNGTIAAVNSRNFFTGDLLKNPPLVENISISPIKPLQVESEVETPEINMPSATTGSVSEENSFTVETTTNETPSGSIEGQNTTINVPRPQIQGYNNSIETQTDLSHRFPYSFDKVIVKGGNFSITSEGNYWYTAPGSINSSNGWYSIGMYPNGTVFYRCFTSYYPFAK